MHNVTLPTPVVVVGSGLFLLAGYLVGVVAGPDSPARTTGEVASYERRTQQLCLVGEAVAEQQGVDAEGRLCGQWKRPAGASSPAIGDSFSFVALRTARDPDAATDDAGPQAGGRVLIYGDVVD